MLSGHNDQIGLIFDFRGWFLNGDNFYFIFANSVKNSLPFHHLFFEFNLLYSIQIVVQITDCVWIALCNTKYIVLMRSTDCERKRIVALPRILNGMVVFEIFNVFSASKPAPLASFFLLSRKYTRQHAIVKQRI